MTVNQHAYFRSNMKALVESSDKRLTLVPCPDYEGCLCFLQKIKMPMVMTNRVIPNLYYLVERQNGTIEWISSSQGTDAIVSQQASEIKKDVVANTIVNYAQFRPIEGGCEVWTVLCLDIGGSIPDSLKRQGASEQIEGIEKNLYSVRHGKPPGK